MSISPDHLLVPATHVNVSARPRLSLRMPSLVAAVKAEGDEANATQHHQVSLMQIDCEGNGVRNGGFKQSGR